MIQDKEVSETEIRARLTAEREELERKFREATKPELATFEVRDFEAWAECVRVNSEDPYSFECVRYAAAWAGLMELRMKSGCSLSDIAKQASYEADTTGITGSMFSIAVSMLARHWVHGENLRECLR